MKKSIENTFMNEKLKKKILTSENVHSIPRLSAVLALF